MKQITVVISAVRPATTGERYIAINIQAGIAGISTWLAEYPTPGPVLIVKERRRRNDN